MSRVKKSAKRWEDGGGWRCFRRAALAGLTELKFRRQLPENDRGTPPSFPNKPPVDLIKTMKWNNGEGEEGEEKVKAWWLKSESYFQQPINSESNGARQEMKARQQCLSCSLPFPSCTERPQVFEVQKTDGKQIKNITSMLSWAETLIAKSK